MKRKSVWILFLFIMAGVMTGCEYSAYVGTYESNDKSNIVLNKDGSCTLKIYYSGDCTFTNNFPRCYDESFDEIKNNCVYSVKNNFLNITYLSDGKDVHKEYKFSKDRETIIAKDKNYYKVNSNTYKNQQEISKSEE